MHNAIMLIGDSYSDQMLYYMTGFLAPDPFIYLQRDGHALLVASPMERDRAEKESRVPDVRSFDDYGYRDLIRQLNDQGRAFTAIVPRVTEDAGVRALQVRGNFPVIYADALRSAGVSVEVATDLLDAQRRRKTPEEIEAIALAQNATERAVAHAVQILRESEIHGDTLVFSGIPLTSERLRTQIEIALLREGMDTGQTPIVAGGRGAADPHWEGAGPLRPHEAIVLDVFPRSKRTRYFADMTRTVVKGAPREPLQTMYDAVLRAQEAALAVIRAGVSGRQVHQAVEDVFKAAGFSGEGAGPRFIHGTGHGVGLDIHESPKLSSTDVELRENDVVTVEPGLYDPQVGAVRIEDLVVVTAGGYRNLTRFPKEFQV